MDPGPPSSSCTARWADGSGWQGVYNVLKDDYSVRIVQNLTLSLEGDVAATKMIIGQQSEPVILVGHSYGGVVITEAGNDPKVAALVYIAGFVPDAGRDGGSAHRNLPVRRAERGRRYSAAAGRLPVTRPGKVP